MQERQQRMEGSLRRGAATLALGVERELQSSVDALTILSHVESLQRGDLAQFERELASRRQLRPSWRGALLADRDGRVLFDTAAPPAQPPRALGALPWFRTLVDAGGGPAVSSLAASEAAARPATLVAVPVRSDGDLRYVLAAWIDVAVWQQLIEQGAPPDEFRSLVDRERRIVARTRAPQQQVGRALPPAAAASLATQPAGFARGALLDGDALYVAWDRVSLGDWRVGVGVAAQPFDDAQRRAIGTAVAVAGACLLLGVALALLGARRLTRPLQQLATHGAARTSERIPVREIALLRDALLVAQAQDEVARERLRKKADEFETLFASSPIGLAFALDPDCREVLHNAAMNELFGPPSVGDAPARHVQVRHRGKPLDPKSMPLQRAAGFGEKVTAMELELLGDDERPPRFVIADAVPLRDAHGRPRGAIGSVVDISERKRVEARLLSADQRLRENQRLIDLAQEAGQVGFFHYRFGSDALTWSPGQAKLFDIAAPHAESLEAWLARIEPEDRARVEAQLRALLAARGERETFEFRLRAIDGGQRWLSTRLLVSYDGAPRQIIGVSVDVTESKRAEEREQAARREAEASNRAKDEFLAMLGHELRNPLSAISSAVEVLNKVDASSEVAGNARAIIARQTRHLANMMEDLLDVARVISGKVKLSRSALDLAALVRRCVGTLEVTGATREHELQVDADEAGAGVWVDGDATRLDQVVNNLLTNAFKYTPAGGRIAVEVSRDGADALLRVRDSGVGISAALLPRVFDLFVQGERTLDRRAGGLGVGLTLVRRLVELHGGRVDAQSPAHGGSVFTVRLPAVDAPARPAAPRHRVPESRRRRVALIEDNDDARDALRTLLELDGHTVSTANDGPSGLDWLLQSRPDVAVIDIGLPGLTGFEVARRSRAAGYAGRMIALSGYGQEADVRKALASGFDAHLVKPVDAETLRRVLIDE
jgi:signal transduction histidine kinase